MRCKDEQFRCQTAPSPLTITRSTTSRHSLDARTRAGRPLLGRRGFCYGQIVARGWESKAVESQQDEAQRRREARPALTPDEQAREAKRATLELALAQTQAEITAACRAAHREMLSLRLEAIRAEIEAL